MFLFSFLAVTSERGFVGMHIAWCPSPPSKEAGEQETEVEEVRCRKRMELSRFQASEVQTLFSKDKSSLFKVCNYTCE